MFDPLALAGSVVEFGPRSSLSSSARRRNPAAAVSRPLMRAMAASVSRRNLDPKSAKGNPDDILRVPYIYRKYYFLTVKLQTLFLARALPARSFAPVVTVALYVAPRVRFLLGFRVAVLPL